MLRFADLDAFCVLCVFIFVRQRSEVSSEMFVEGKFWRVSVVEGETILDFGYFVHFVDDRIVLKFLGFLLLLHVKT